MVSRLEEIANLLEQGDLPLEETVRIYREALKLSSACSRLLEKYRQEITVLLENGEEVELDEQSVQSGGN